MPFDVKNTENEERTSPRKTGDISGSPSKLSAFSSLQLSQLVKGACSLPDQKAISLKAQGQFLSFVHADTGVLQSSAMEHLPRLHNPQIKKTLGPQYRTRTMTSNQMYHHHSLAPVSTAEATDDENLPSGSYEVLDMALDRFAKRVWKMQLDHIWSASVKDSEDAVDETPVGKERMRHELLETLIPDCYFEVCQGLEKLRPGATWSCTVS